MAEDIFKPRGVQKAFKPDAGGAAVKNTPVFGVVKDNIDPVRAGRLRVYVAEFGGNNPDDSSYWITVNYMTPFFGFTPGSPPNTGYGNYQQNSTSYGMWTSPPDIGTTVICIFINGDPNYGYWIGCVPDPEKLTMVPAIGGQKVVVPNEAEAQSVGGAKILPVTNMNSNNERLNQSPRYFDEPKPINSYAIQTLNYQGLLRDNVRGVISSSAQRETPSRVGFGVSTPGRPIYKGGADDNTIIKDIQQNNVDKTKIVSRRPGHTFVMDDGDISGKDQLIRLRTSLGHQILMSDDGQCLFIIHANGKSWVELGKEGTIDMYATNSVNIRTQGDLNLHADRNININALGDLNLKGNNLNIEAETNLTERAGLNFSGFAGGAYTFKATTGLSMNSGGIASMSGVGPLYLRGKPLFLNTGTSPLQPVEVPKIPLKFHVDTLYDNTKGWASAPGKLVSITSRAPAHAPWAYAGLGVDVKINNNANAALPSAPNNAVTQANQSSQAVPSSPTTPSLISTVPPVPTSSAAKTIDPTTSSAMVSQIASSAAQNPVTREAVNRGYGIVQGNNGPTPVLGLLAATPEQLEQGGYIKAGSAALVNGLIQQGKTIQEAYPDNVFTGKDGVNNLNDYINNVEAQVRNAQTNFSQSERGLIRTGILTGRESGTSTAGIIMAATTSGLNKTLDYVKNAASNAINDILRSTKPVIQNLTAVGSEAFNRISGIANNIGNLSNNVFGNVSQSFSAGNFASGLATNVVGGLSSVASSLVAKIPMTGGISKVFQMVTNAAKGVSEFAFRQITSSFPNLTPNQPNNLTDTTNRAEFTSQEANMQVQTTPSSADIASGAASAANNALQVTSLSLTDPTFVINRVNDNNAATLAKTIKDTKETVLQNSATSSGTSMLPGGLGAIASFVDKSKSIVTNMPGIVPIQTAIKSVIGSVSSATTPFVNLGSQVTNLLSSIGKKSSLTKETIAGLPSGTSSQIQSAMSSLSSLGPSAKPAIVATNTDTTNPSTNSFLPAGTPPPNYTGLNPEAERLSQTQQAIWNLESLQKYRDTYYQGTLLPTINALNKAKQELPAGDPEITRLQLLYEAELVAYQNINKDIETLANRAKA